VTVAAAASTSATVGLAWSYARWLSTFATKVTFHSGQGAAESLRQHVQALVRIRLPEPYDLAVIDLAIPAGDPGHGVEVLRFHCDVQPPANQSALGRCGARDIACNVILDDRAV
jgi:hypothetical protein